MQLVDMNGGTFPGWQRLQLSVFPIPLKARSFPCGRAMINSFVAGRLGFLCDSDTYVEERTDEALNRIRFPMTI